MNNSYFGKTMENVKKRKNFKVHTDEKLITKNIASSLTKNIHVFDENLFGFDKRKTSFLVCLKKNTIWKKSCIKKITKYVIADFLYFFSL